MSHGSIRILLVEDNQLHAHLLQGFLKELGSPPFPVQWVQSLQEGLEAIREQDFDVVLLDLVLPDSRGLETFLQWRSAVPQLPVVVLTGLDDMELATQAVESGAQDYLIKNQINRALLSRSLRYTAERSGAGSQEWDSPMLHSAHQQFLRAARAIDLDADLRSGLLFPANTRIVSLPFRREDNSRVEQIFAYRVQHLLTRGPTLGPVCYQPQLVLGDLAARAMGISWQCALFGVAAGGAQGGVKIDRTTLTKEQAQRLDQGYLDRLTQSADEDIIQVDDQSRERIEEAAVAGLGALIKQAATLRGLDLAGARVIISGFDSKMSQRTAHFLDTAGARIVGIGEGTTGVWNEEGHEFSKVLEFMNSHKQMTQTLDGDVTLHQELLEQDCDILVLQTSSHPLITTSLAERLRCKILVEGVHLSMTPETDDLLEERDIFVVPDIFGQGGAILASHRQWLHDTQQIKWTIDKLCEDLTQTFEHVIRRGQKDGICLRQAAIIEALEFMADSDRD